MQMKRLPVVMVFLMILILIPSQNSVSSSPEIIFDFSELVEHNFTPIGEAQIFGTIPFDVNQTYVQELAEALFNLTGTVSVDDGMIRVENGSESFEMYTECGSIWYADESKLWNLSYFPTLPTLTESKAYADKLITSNSYFEETQSSSFGSTNATAYQINTEEMSSRILNYDVNYGFELNGIPFGGPGGSSSISLGHNGEIIAINWVKRATTPLHMEDLYSAEDILTMHGITNYASFDYELVYFHDEVGAKQEYVYPAYDIELVQLFNDNEVNTTFCLPATSFNPIIAITDPFDGKIANYGDELFFNSSVIFGTGPFSYYWYSDIDGLISTSASFSKADLSSATRGNESISHTISLNVTDGHGLTCDDIIQVEVKPQVTSSSAIGYLAIIFIIGGALIQFVSKTNSRKRKTLATMLSLASIIVISNFTAIMRVKATVYIIDYNEYVEVASDDDSHGVYEFGAEYISKWDTQADLPKADNAARNIWAKLRKKTSNWNKEFFWGEDKAWERDFKNHLAYPNGWDNQFVDNVDLCYYAGHGNPYGVNFNAKVDKTWIDYTEIQWGDGDLEWMLFDTCLTLKFDYSGGNVFERWGPTMKGLHMICGFNTVTYTSKTRGEKFVKQCTKGHTIRYSWFKAAKQTENKKIWSAVFYGSISDDSWNPQQDDVHNDHLWGTGYVASDPYPGAKWWVWITSRC